MTCIHTWQLANFFVSMPQLHNEAICLQGDAQPVWSYIFVWLVVRVRPTQDMHTQVLILFGVDKYLVVVITRAMPSFLDHVYQILSGDSVPAVCLLRYFLLFFVCWFCQKYIQHPYQRNCFNKDDSTVSPLYSREHALWDQCTAINLPGSDWPRTEFQGREDLKQSRRQWHEMLHSEAQDARMRVGWVQNTTG